MNIDRPSTSGQGSTSSSVAIVRTHYSTVEGSALAWEGTQCWENWLDHIGLKTRSAWRSSDKPAYSLSKPKKTGIGKTDFCSDELGSPMKNGQFKGSLTSYPAGKRRNSAPLYCRTRSVRQHTGPSIEGPCCFHVGATATPQRLATHNLQVATEARGYISI
ncbi:MAG: hypothetical protein Ct9H300mP14_13940 [Gammaproteobacteria bacterium]|nr:MAG: hypothetical protein Ct9H300mP14_13940 [Gammaproteobacteria bacterium]